MTELTSTIVVGAGGIGSILMPYISRELMAGNLQHVWLVDGDRYEEKNLVRQFFSPICLGMNKAEAQVLKSSVLDPKLKQKLHAVPNMLTEPTITSLLPIIAHNSRWVVFSCVDNHACRALLAKWVDTQLETIPWLEMCLITGGNDEWDGNTHLYGRWDIQGIATSLGTPLLKRHPELLTDQEGSREGLSCQELINLTGGRQRLVANAMAANTMFMAYTALMDNPQALKHVEDAYFDAREYRMQIIRHDEVDGVKELPSVTAPI